MSATYHLVSQAPTCSPGAPAFKDSHVWEIQPLYKEQRHSADSNNSRVGNTKAPFRGQP